MSRSAAAVTALRIRQRKLPRYAACSCTARRMVKECKNACPLIYSGLLYAAKSVGLLRIQCCTIMTEVALEQPPALRTLFLHAPSFDGFDGGAGSRYQAKREIKSFWFPTWLAQPAALVPGSRVVDAPADELTVEQTRQIARDYELVIMHTSTPSFPTDARFAELLKQDNPQIRIGLVGAKPMVDPEGSLKATTAIDFVCREEFDYTCKEVAEGVPLEDIKGLSYRDTAGRIVHNLPRAMIENM